MFVSAAVENGREREIIPDWQESSGTVATRLGLAFIESGAGAERQESQWNRCCTAEGSLELPQEKASM